MTHTLSESELELFRKRQEAREVRRAREKANRVGTNLKPHIRDLIDRLAEEAHVPTRTMIRILLLEALEERGVNLLDVLRAWKEKNPEEADAE